MQLLKSKSSPKLGVGSPPKAGSGTVANFRIKMEGEPGEPSLACGSVPETLKGLRSVTRALREEGRESGRFQQSPRARPGSDGAAGGGELDQL